MIPGLSVPLKVSWLRPLQRIEQEKQKRSWEIVISHVA
jgi:hypothetical protein